MSNGQEPNEKNSLLDKSGSDPSIPLEDRVQATLRSSQYQKDWDEHFPEKGTGWMKKFSHSEDKILKPLAPHPQKDHSLARKWCLPFLEPPWDPYCMEGRYYTNGQTQLSCEVIADQDHGYLDLRVYLEAPATVIRETVMKLVDTYQQKLDLTTRAPRSTKNKEVDLWEVYDMHHFLKKNQMQIARDLWPEEDLKDPAIDPHTKKRWAQISRALQKANRYVQQVKEEAERD